VGVTKRVLGLVSWFALVGLVLTGCAAATTAGRPAAAPLAPSAAASSASAATIGHANDAAAAPAATRAVPPSTAVRPSTAIAPPKPKPKPVPNPCAGNAHAQLVKVSIAAQHLWMCAGPKAVYSTPVTTGASALPYDSTPTGTFQIQGRDRNTTLTLNTGQTYAVQYWIPFQGPLFGFHDASWQNFPYGSPLYRTQGSHGCVHMPLAAIAYLYNWAQTGATVTIH
jgi:lipoprotein-anchoring transpeptidase ErfK/SrfK